MKRLSVLLLAILMVFGFSTAASAVSVEIDFYGGTTGLDQGVYDTGSTITLDWTLGDFVNVDIVMAEVPGDPVGLAAFAFVMPFDPAEVALSDLKPNPGFFTFPANTGIFADFLSVEAFGTPPLPGDDVVMLSFVLTCTGTGVFDLVLFDLNDEPNSGLGDGTVLDDLFDGTTVFATVNQVPVPGAVWLLGSGLLGLVGLRRKLKS
jgi:hypothetical protein